MSSRRVYPSPIRVPYCEDSRIASTKKAVTRRLSRAEVARAVTRFAMGAGKTVGLSAEEGTIAPPAEDERGVMGPIMGVMLGTETRTSARESRVDDDDVDWCDWCDTSRAGESCTIRAVLMLAWSEKEGRRGRSDAIPVVFPSLCNECVIVEVASVGSESRYFVYFGMCSTHVG